MAGVALVTRRGRDRFSVRVACRRRVPGRDAVLRHLGRVAQAPRQRALAVRRRGLEPARRRARRCCPRLAFAPPAGPITPAVVANLLGLALLCSAVAYLLVLPADPRHRTDAHHDGDLPHPRLRHRSGGCCSSASGSPGRSWPGRCSSSAGRPPCWCDAPRPADRIRPRRTHVPRRPSHAPRHRRRPGLPRAGRLCDPPGQPADPAGERRSRLSLPDAPRRGSRSRRRC